MEKKTLFILTTIIFALNMFLLLGLTSSITGYTIAERASSFFFGNALAALAPIIILSLILATGVFALYELKKQ